jgi:hypothetical protein
VRYKSLTWASVHPFVHSVRLNPPCIGA